RLDERLLAIHHPRAGTLAELFDQCRFDVHAGPRSVAGAPRGPEVSVTGPSYGPAVQGGRRPRRRKGGRTTVDYRAAEKVSDTFKKSADRRYCWLSASAAAGCASSAGAPPSPEGADSADGAPDAASAAGFASVFGRGFAARPGHFFDADFLRPVPTFGRPSSSSSTNSSSPAGTSGIDALPASTASAMPAA